MTQNRAEDGVLEINLMFYSLRFGITLASCCYGGIDGLDWPVDGR